MGADVAAACLQFSHQPVLSRSSSSQASAILSSPSLRHGRERFISCRFARQYFDQSSIFELSGKKYLRSRSCDNARKETQRLRRSCSASLDDSSTHGENFDDEDFSKKLERLHLHGQYPHVDDDFTDAESLSTHHPTHLPENGTEAAYKRIILGNFDSSFYATSTTPWNGIPPEPPDWSESQSLIQASIEIRAKCVDLPLSLRIIKKKKRWLEGFKEVKESTLCSVKKAFSSTVFMVRELLFFALQMRENLFSGDLQEILIRVQKEINASFVWLFQHVFSHTPILMVYIMLLLANFTVFSLEYSTTAIIPPTTTIFSDSIASPEDTNKLKFVKSSIKSLSNSYSSAVVGGYYGGGSHGNLRPVTGATDGDDQFNRLNVNQISLVQNSKMEVEPFSGSEMEEEKLWTSMVEETSKMQVVDRELMKQFVSPITVKIEPEDSSSHFRTELQYQQALSQEPENHLLLSNYAQFLYLVIHDHDRAEEYFKRATQIKPADAESLCLYATFLWQARKDLNAAEETYLEAIDADPMNTYYAASYAHFLWNTGGEDTCFPLDEDK